MAENFDPIREARRQWEAHGYAGAADGMTLTTSIMRSQQLLMARIDRALRPLKLTFARYELLTLLRFSSHGELPMSVVSRRLQVHPTSTTNAVDRLERVGLVKRTPHPDDGRSTIVQLTKAGRELSLAATDALNREVFTHPGIEGERMDLLLQLLAEHRAALAED